MVKFVRFREAKKNFFLSKASITEDLANGEEKKLFVVPLHCVNDQNNFSELKNIYG